MDEEVPPDGGGKTPSLPLLLLPKTVLVFFSCCYRCFTGKETKAQKV